MGAGKTTIGKMLAKQLKMPFFDSDREIEKRTGVSIALIFELEQERGFRSREKAVIKDLTSQDGIVLATGGGAILDPENRSQLQSGGHVIYLKAPIDQLLKRTSHDNSRPLLQTPNPKKTLEEIMSIREPLYTEVADTIINTHSNSTRKVVDKICKLANKLNL